MPGKMMVAPDASVAVTVKVAVCVPPSSPIEISDFDSAMPAGRPPNVTLTLSATPCDTVVEICAVPSGEPVPFAEA